MDRKPQAHFEARVRILKALAHPTRLFIVDELSRGERCVCELTEMIGADMSTVSKHLALLKNAGLVAVDKRGNQVFYSLRSPGVSSLLECAERVLEDHIKEQIGILSWTDV